MHIRKATYILCIITGILIEKYGLQINNPLETLFGASMIGYGGFSIFLDWFKKK